MSTCPEGHQSDSDDYCDVCGTPIEDATGQEASAPAAPATSAPPPAAPKPQGVACPNCQSENVPDALFCEACGYDFTTGTMPRPWVNPFAQADDAPSPPSSDDPASDEPASDEPAAEDSAGAPSAEPVGAPADEPGGDDVSATLEDRDDAPAGPDEDGLALPPEDDVSTSLEDRDDAPSGAPSGSLEDQEVAPGANLPSSPEDRDEASDAAPSTPSVERADAPGDAPSTSLDAGSVTPPEPVDEPEDDPFTWVAELWVDPDWYRHQEPPDPMPSPGLPEVVPLQKRSVLVGRPSRSRGIHPDIDCDPDPGTSRRQAQLTTDGRRWWVEDLDSSNGTYVAGAAEGLPDRAIPVGQRHELDPDDRIYLGAWTRLVIRKATDEERETFAP